jgi:hypothetical protein
MNYAKATTEQELLDMVAHLEGKGYKKHKACLSGNTSTCHPYVGIMHGGGLIYNTLEPAWWLQGNEVSVAEFLKQ